MPVYAGGSVMLANAAPASEDALGFAALTWTNTMHNVISISGLGDTHTDVPVELLAGRTVHFNGGADGGEITVTFQNFSGVSGGHTLVRERAGTNLPISMRITDPGGGLTYVSGVVANLQDNERAQNGFQGQTFVLRANTRVVRA